MLHTTTDFVDRLTNTLLPLDKHSYRFRRWSDILHLLVLFVNYIESKRNIVIVCLSTVDRRSRERFIESNNQIASLVEKFKLEGGAYRKYVGPPPGKIIRVLMVGHK